MAVALFARVPAVQVRDSGHRAHVGRLRRTAAIPTQKTTGWVGPVQCLIDGEQVRQETAVSVHEVVDPSGADRHVVPGLDGGARVAEAARVPHGAIAPHGGLWVGRREDLLLELAHGDLVVIDAMACLPLCRWHCGGDGQLGDEPRDRGRVERAGRHGRTRVLVPYLAAHGAGGGRGSTTRAGLEGQTGRSQQAGFQESAAVELWLALSHDVILFLCGTASGCAAIGRAGPHTRHPRAGRHHAPDWAMIA